MQHAYGVYMCIGLDFIKSTLDILLTISNFLKMSTNSH